MDQRSDLGSPSHSQSPHHVFSQYKEITARLKNKTRSLIPSKKINLQDLSQQFVLLSKQVSSYSKAYSGHCLLSAARTERLVPAPNSCLGNELLYLLESGRSFREDAFDPEDHFDPKRQESIDACVSCFRHSLKISHESVVPSLLHELGRTHERTGDYSEASRVFFEGKHYVDAASSSIQNNDFISALNSYEKIPGNLLTTHDMITVYLLKLAANDVHVLRVVCDHEDYHSSSHLFTNRMSAMSHISLKSTRSHGMRRLSSVNIPDFFVSIQFPVIPLTQPWEHTNLFCQDQHVLFDKNNTLITSGVLNQPLYPKTSGADNLRAKTRDISALNVTPSESSSSSTTAPSATSLGTCLGGYGSKGYRDMLLMNEDTLNLNILLESLYLFLKEFGSEMKLLVNSSWCQHDMTSSNCSSNNNRAVGVEVDDEDEDDDFDEEDELEEVRDNGGNKMKRNRFTRQQVDMETRDELFNQLYSALKHKDHRKLVSFLLMPSSSF